LHCPVAQADPGQLLPCRREAILIPGLMAGALRVGFMEQGLRWVVDVDISKYFDTIDHAHLRRFLDQRLRAAGRGRLCRSTHAGDL
jgi:hypothetical protein